MNAVSGRTSVGKLFERTQSKAQTCPCVDCFPLFPASWYLIGNSIDIRRTLSSKTEDRGEGKSSLFLLCFSIFLFWLRWPFAVYENFMVESELRYIMVTRYIVSAMFQLKMFVSGGKLRSFISRVGATLTPRDRCYLNIVSIIVTMNVVAQSLEGTYFAYAASASLNRTLLMEKNIFSNGTLIPSTMSNVLLSFWDQMIYDPLRVSMVLYCVATFMLHCFAEERIKVLMEVASLGLDKEMIQIAYDMKLALDEFESLFCVCPFIWLVFGTLYSTFLIIRIIENVDYRVLTPILFQVHLQFTIVSVLLAVSIMAEKMQSHKSAIVTAYTRGGASYRQMSNTVMLTLQYTLDNNFSIWRIGQISRSAILTYLGTIVTFSVLFTQIKNGSLSH